MDEQDTIADLGDLTIGDLDERTATLVRSPDGAVWTAQGVMTLAEALAVLSAAIDGVVPVARRLTVVVALAHPPQPTGVCG